MGVQTPFRGRIFTRVVFSVCPQGVSFNKWAENSVIFHKSLVFTLFMGKNIRQVKKSQKKAKKPNLNFKAKPIEKKPNFWNLASKKPNWHPWYQPSDSIYCLKITHRLLKIIYVIDHCLTNFKAISTYQAHFKAGIISFTTIYMLVLSKIKIA